jgi:hypothetical protein
MAASLCSLCLSLLKNRIVKAIPKERSAFSCQHHQRGHFSFRLTAEG